MGGDREIQLDYVQRVMQRHDLTQSELATRSGLNTSTLSRFLTGDEEGRLLSTRTIRRIESYSGVLFNPHQTDEQTPSVPRKNGFSDADATPFRMDMEQPEQFDNAVLALVGKKNDVVPWVLRSRALENAGYCPGDVLIVELNTQPKVGDVVCAQVYDFERGGAETVFRVYQPPCLVSSTNDKSLLRPYIVDTANVHIKGVVTTSLRDSRNPKNH